MDSVCTRVCVCVFVRIVYKRYKLFFKDTKLRAKNYGSIVTGQIHDT